MNCKTHFKRFSKEAVPLNRPEKSRTREEIQRDVDVYLKNGGKISEVPYGVQTINAEDFGDEAYKNFCFRSVAE